jgi:hypothetical protein
VASPTTIDQVVPCAAVVRGRMILAMTTSQPQPNAPRLLAAALAPGRSAHERQRDLVRASLLAPGRRAERTSARRAA